MIYIESIDFTNIQGVLLKDLLIAESKYSKEAWGVYRYYYLLVENLLNQTGMQYLDEVLTASSLCFDTYCSTLAAYPKRIDLDACILELERRRASAQEANLIKLYEMGIDMFTGYKSRLHKLDEIVTEKERILPKISFIKRLKNFFQK